MTNHGFATMSMESGPRRERVENEKGGRIGDTGDVLNDSRRPSSVMSVVTQGDSQEPSSPARAPSSLAGFFHVATSCPVWPASISSSLARASLAQPCHFGMPTFQPST